MTKIDTNKIAPLQCYYTPQGGGVKPHDAGMLYLRDDVDAAIAALTAERDALRAEVERLRVDTLREAAAIVECIAPTLLPEDPRAAYQQAIDAAVAFLNARADAAEK